MSRGIERFRASVKMFSGTFFTMKTGSFDAAENEIDLIFEDSDGKPPFIDSEDCAELARYFRMLANTFEEASKKPDEELIDTFIDLNKMRSDNQDQGN
ncbi:hypothetical protein [Brevibacillus choshinensis]|uniref:hypothetical protein n=1 Tax=Brevibacillus choshinensis TaxID=54911 RepID=UPI002E1CB37F|nr:hypothetical protein [Brevibacillus choshinensis]